MNTRIYQIDVCMKSNRPFRKEEEEIEIQALGLPYGAFELWTHLLQVSRIRHFFSQILVLMFDGEIQDSRDLEWVRKWTQAQKKRTCTSIEDREWWREYSVFNSKRKGSLFNFYPPNGENGMNGAKYKKQGWKQKYLRVEACFLIRIRVYLINAAAHVEFSPMVSSFCSSFLFLTRFRVWFSVEKSEDRGNTLWCCSKIYVWYNYFYAKKKIKNDLNFQHFQKRGSENFLRWKRKRCM